MGPNIKWATTIKIATKKKIQLTQIPCFMAIVIQIPIPIKAMARINRLRTINRRKACMRLKLKCETTHFEEFPQVFFR